MICSTKLAAVMIFQKSLHPVRTIFAILKEAKERHENFKPFVKPISHYDAPLY